jgi:hypothetical protein
MKNSQMGHGSSVAQRSWPLVTRAMAALLTFAASFEAGSFAAVASDQAGRGEMRPMIVGGLNRPSRAAR